MKGISPALLKRLRKTLSNCGPFYSPDELRTVFNDERISLWRGSLPDAKSEASRIDLTIDHLLGKYDSSGVNALALLMRVLSDRKKGDRCYKELEDAAYLLELELQKDGSVNLLNDEINSKLLSLLLNHFNLEELKTLCFKLNITFDDLEGEGRRGKARELILLLKRQDRIHDLLEQIGKSRPNISM